MPACAVKLSAGRIETVAGMSLTQRRQGAKPQRERKGGSSHSRRPPGARWDPGKTPPKAMLTTTGALTPMLYAAHRAPIRHVSRVDPQSSHEHVGRAALSLLPPFLAATGRGNGWGLPVERAESFHACSGSPTPRRQRAARVYRRPSCCLPPVRTRSARRSDDFGAEYPACMYPCQRLTRGVTTTGA